MQIQGLYVMESEKGRGVYSAHPVGAGSIIEVCHVIVIPKSELPIIHKTSLHDYYFSWGRDFEEAALALGYGSLYNHSYEPNARFILDYEHMTIDIEAISDIDEGEEVTIDYHQDADDQDLWFDVV